MGVFLGANVVEFDNIAALVAALNGALTGNLGSILSEIDSE